VGVCSCPWDAMTAPWRSADMFGIRSSSGYLGRPGTNWRNGRRRLSKAFGGHLAMVFLSGTDSMVRHKRSRFSLSIPYTALRYRV
jgi:hypothetical protein